MSMKDTKKDKKERPFMKQKEAMSQMVDKMAPRFSLSSKELPEIKDWKVGGNYKVEMEIVQKGIHEGMNGEMIGEFEIKSVEVCDE